MPKASISTASEHLEVEGYEGHFERFDGGYTVGFERYTADADLSPFFAGLPDDRCQCPHWGYVVRGRMRVRYADREEVLAAGDAYHLPPGHTTVTEEPTELIEFSPLGAYQKTLEVAARNLAAMQAR